MRICGLDEAGRGALAGPLVAAAVIFPSTSSGQEMPKLRDSKKLNSKQRNRLYKKIIKRAETVEIEMISARQINNRGMGWANREIFKRLIKRISADKYIIDGNLKIRKAKSVIKADRKIKCVMAASAVAKVERDKLMSQLHKDFPKYGWKSNKGYGTKHHIQAIRKYGATKCHRSMFVATALEH